MSELRVHLPNYHARRSDTPMTRRRPSPEPFAPSSIFTTPERFTGSLIDLIAAARPQIQAAEAAGRLAFAPVKKAGDELVEEANQSQSS